VLVLQAGNQGRVQVAAPCRLGPPLQESSTGEPTCRRSRRGNQGSSPSGPMPRLTRQLTQPLSVPHHWSASWAGVVAGRDASRVVLHHHSQCRGRNPRLQVRGSASSLPVSGSQPKTPSVGVIFLTNFFH
jgi:hypothetical protein